MDTAPNQLVSQADRLVDDFLRLTQEQHTLLGSQEPDTTRLNASLAERRQVLEAMSKAYLALEGCDIGAQERDRLSAKLAQAKALDDQNLALADGQVKELRDLARQMTQTRKVVSGYSRSDLAGATPSFDKKQ